MLLIDGTANSQIQIKINNWKGVAFRTQNYSSPTEYSKYKVGELAFSSIIT